VSTIIRYTNPERRPNGTYRCVACLTIHTNADDARNCAVADHEKKAKAVKAAKRGKKK
jgi:hypothetical protein